MGCAQSRDETRQAAFGADYNTVPYAFKVYDNTTGIADLHPFDKLTVAYVGSDAKEAADATFGAFKEGKWGKPDAITAATKTLFTELKALHEWAKTNADAEKPTNFGKYNQKQILDDLDGTLTKIAGVVEELKWPEAAPAAADGAAAGGDAAPAGGADAGAEGAQNEGGDEAAPAGEGAAAAAPAAAEGGESKIPAELLAAYLAHPFFADLVKSQVTHAEVVPAFNLFGKGLAVVDPLALIPNGPPKVDAKFVASVLFFFVNAQENKSEDKEIWFAAHFTDADLEELNEATGD